MKKALVLLLALTACHDDLPTPVPTPQPTTPIVSATASAAVAPPPSATTPPAELVTVMAQHVLIAWRGAERAPKTVTRSKVDAKKRADEVLAKAKAGEDFTALVSTYSDDPAAKERLGSVGKFKREGMAKPFSDAAFALKVDEVSPVVETAFGFHVIKRNQ
ncbi:MAG: peptidylprolyl isomerase [Polyangiaceae bacterium]